MSPMTLGSFRQTLLCGVAAGAVAMQAEAAFVGFMVVTSPAASGGENLIRYEVFAEFNGPTDTVLNVFNLRSLGSTTISTEDATGFWHKDNSGYSGGVLSQQFGTWAPQLTGSATTNRPFDSFLLIGGNPTFTNGTAATGSWPTPPGWDRPDLPVVQPSDIGWFNGNPTNNQGRVGVAPNTANFVKVAQFVLSEGHLSKVYSLSIAYTNGAGGSIVFDTGCIALNLAGCIEQTFYRDFDADGFGRAASGTVVATVAPPGFVSNNLDCNDSDAAINPNTVWYRDLDGDGFGFAGSGTQTQCVQPSGHVINNLDCDDSNAAINPNTIWYRDVDGDGYGSSDDGMLNQCPQPPGFVLNPSDNCPSIANSDQADCDRDSVGDACEIADGQSSDCDGNGVPDSCDIAAGESDANLNGVIDACELARGDLNLDGVINGADLALLLSIWGSSNPPTGDLNGDGSVGGADLTILLSNWGVAP